MDSAQSLEYEIEKLIEDKEYDKALGILNEKIITSVEPEIIALCLIERAKLWGILKEPYKMEEDINKAVQVFYDIKDSEYKGKIALYLGSSFLFSGDTYNALKFYREAIKHLPECSEDYIRAVYNIGEVQKRIGHLDDALEKFHSCYAKAKSNEDTKLQVYSAENMAEIYLIKGAIEEAKRWLRKAEEALKNLDEERGKLIVGLAIAIMNNDEAEIGRISERFKEIGMEHDMADIYYYYSDLADDRLRERLLKDASFIFSDLGDGRMLSLTLSKLHK